MINEEKVATMTRMAAYEKRQGRRDEEICSYFRNDYVGFQLLKTWIYTTIAFAILVGIYAVYRIDAIMERFYSLSVDGIWDLGKRMALAYVILCAIYLAITWIVSHVTYSKAFKETVLFDKMLTEIDGSEEEEE